jgi:hypothetical protein
MKLYDIAQEYNEILRLVDAGELTQEMIADTLESIGAEFEAKARNCMMIVSQLDSDSDGIKTQIDRLKALQKSVDNSRENLVDYIKEQMISIGSERLDLGIFKLTVRAATKAVNVLDESKIPEQYWRVIPESKVVDKSALSAALKIGIVDGAELVDGKRALLIK